MESDITLGKESSFILAEGKRGLPFGFWWWVAGAILLAIIVIFGWFFVSLAQAVTVPDSPSVTVVASPETINALPEELKQSLPESLREALDEKTSWPMIMSLYREGQAWNWYAIGPVWQIPNPDEVHGLVAIAYKDSPGAEQEKRPIRYTSSLTTRLPFFKKMLIKIEPELLAEATGLDIQFDDNRPITGTYRDGKFIFDVAYEGSAPNEALYAADLSINIPRNGVTEEAIRDFIRRMSNGRHSHVNTPELAQYHVWLDDLGRPEFTIYSFSSEMTEMQAAELLGVYGFYSRQAALLPDGTLSYEHVLPTSSTDALFGDRVNEQDELISLKEDELRVSAKNASPATFFAPNTCGHENWMRLSGKSLKILLQSLGSNAPNANLPNIQIGSLENKLSVCFE